MRQVSMPALVGIPFRREGEEHAIDVLEVLVGIPTATHAVDIELECIVREALTVEDGHGLGKLEFRGSYAMHAGFRELLKGGIASVGIVCAGDDDRGGAVL